ncbi:MAG: GHKL domain-containing protein [Clostridiales bacterium]
MDLLIAFIDCLMMFFDALTTFFLLASLLPRRRPGAGPVLCFFLGQIFYQLFNRLYWPGAYWQGLLVNWLADFLLAHLFFRGSLKRKSLLIAVTYTIFTACDGIAAIIIYLFRPELWPPAAAPQDIKLNILIFFSRSLLPLILAFLIRSFFRKDGDHRHWLIFFMLALYTSLLLFQMFPLEDFTKKQILFLVVGCFFALLVMLAVFSYLCFQDHKSFSEERLRLLEKLKAFQDQHNRELKFSFAQMEHTLHDIRKHIGYLELLSAAGREESISQYIQGLRQKLEPPLFTGNFTIDAILFLKKRQGAEMGIPLQSSGALPEELPWLDAADMVALLGNALDNALEECSRLPQQDPSLGIALTFLFDEGIYCEIENPIAAKPIEKYRGSRLPGKQGGKGRGLGLESMQAAVDKYGGQMRVFVSNGTFRLHLFIPRPH